MVIFHGELLNNQMVGFTKGQNDHLYSCWLLWCKLVGQVGTLVHEQLPSKTTASIRYLGPYQAKIETSSSATLQLLKQTPTFEFPSRNYGIPNFWTMVPGVMELVGTWIIVTHLT